MCDICYIFLLPLIGRILVKTSDIGTKFLEFTIKNILQVFSFCIVNFDRFAFALSYK